MTKTTSEDVRQMVQSTHGQCPNLGRMLSEKTELRMVHWVELCEKETGRQTDTSGRRLLFFRIIHDS